MSSSQGTFKIGARTDLIPLRCDSGMGEVTAVHLAKLGFKVFAGIYLEASAEKLKNQNSAIVPVRIDVSKEESVKAAAETVKQ